MHRQGRTTKNGEQLAVFRSLGTWFLWFAITLTLLILLFFLAACIPNTLIKENTFESARYLNGEELFDQWKEGDRRTEIHNYADAITLNILYSMDGEECWKAVLISPFYSDGVNLDKTVTQLLVERLKGEREADTVYDRYWHGMIVFLRPLLIFFTIQEIRWLFLGVLLGLLFFLAGILIRKKQRPAALVLIISAILVQLPVTAFCIEYVPTIWIMLGSAVAMICYAEERRKILRICVISGVCVAFFDFLTTETLAIVVPLALVYGIWEKNDKVQKLGEEIRFLFHALLSWGMAYVFGYVVKWCLASMVLKQNRIATAIDAFLGRQGSGIVSFALDSLVQGKELGAEAVKMAGGTVLPAPVSAVFMNFRLLLGLSGKITLEALALAGVFGCMIVFGLIYLYKKRGSMVYPVVLLLLGLIPIARMMVLYSHSIEHCFFVYRALLGTIFCFLMGFTNVIDWNKLHRRIKK